MENNPSYRVEDISIKEEDIRNKGIGSLRDAPNRRGGFGNDGLSAEELKRRFDELPRLIIERLNALCVLVKNGVLSEDLVIKKNTDGTMITLADLMDYAERIEREYKSEDARIEREYKDADSKAIAAAKSYTDAEVSALSKEYGEILSKAKAHTDERFNAILGDDASPALDTLYELAKALGDDPNFAATIVEQIGKKLDKAEVAAGNYYLYGVGSDGKTQKMYYLGYSPMAGRVPLYDADGQLRVGSAAREDAAVPLSQMNETLDVRDGEIYTDVEILRKRVVNLEKGIVPDPEYTDSSVAYRKEVPQNALPYAAVMGVGGMTHRVEGKNLFNIEALKSDTGAVGRLTISGNQVKLAAQNEEPWRDCADYTTLLFKDVCPEAKVGKTYTLSCVTSPVTSGSAYEEGSRSVYMYPSGTFVLTEGMYNSPIEFYAGEYFEIDYYSMEAVFQNIMLNEGSVALPYVEYAPPKLQDTKVTALEIVGKNLFDESAVTGTINGVGAFENAATITDEYLSIKFGSFVSSIFLTPFVFFLHEGQDLAISADVFVPTGGAPTLGIALGIGNPLKNFAKSVRYPNLSAYDEWQRVSATVNAKKTGWHFLLLQGYGNASNFHNLDVRFKNITVTTDLTVTDHIPYRKSTFPIPAEVQAIDGNGRGILGAEYEISGVKFDDVYNGIELDADGKATFVKRVEKIVCKGADDENWWGLTEGSHRYYVMRFVPLDSHAPCLSNLYPSRGFSAGIPCIYTNSNQQIVVFPDGALGDPTSTVDDWKAWLAEQYAAGKPLEICYALATPVVTDVSAYFSPDNFIEVEGGGVITAVNEHEQAAPTSILYQLKPTE